MSGTGLMLYRSVEMEKLLELSSVTMEIKVMLISVILFVQEMWLAGTVQEEVQVLSQIVMGGAEMDI